MFQIFLHHRRICASTSTPGDEIFSQSLSALGVPHQGLLVTTVGTTSGDYDDGTNQYFIDQGKVFLTGIRMEIPPRLFHGRMSKIRIIFM